MKEYGFGDIKFVLAVRSNRRSDSVKDLAEDIALLGCALNEGRIQDAPETSFAFEPSQYPLNIDVTYENGQPVMYPGKPCRVNLNLKNISSQTLKMDFRLVGCNCKENFSLVIAPGETAVYPFDASIDDENLIYDRNIYSLHYSFGEEEKRFDFGVVGAMPWKVIGPIWRTDPICNTEILQSYDLKYGDLIKAVPYDGNETDVMRRFHLNFAIDTATEYMKHDDCFAPFHEAAETAYEESVFWQTQDSFTMDDLFGFQGPCVAYLSRELICPEDMEVCAQIGHSTPFSLSINGDLIANRDHCDCWDAENVHIEHIKLKKGINRILLRLTRANKDAKFSLIFSDGACCARHYVCFGAVVPSKF